MDTKLLPIVHLQVRARELLVEQLAIEGVSEQGRADADDALAKQLWSFGTADTIMESIQEILPAAEYKSLLAFCHNQYPILYSTLPPRLKGLNEQFSWPQHSSFYKDDMLASAAQRATGRSYNAESFGSQSFGTETAAAATVLQLERRRLVIRSQGGARPERPLSWFKRPTGQAVVSGRGEIGRMFTALLRGLGRMVLW